MARLCGSPYGSIGHRRDEYLKDTSLEPAIDLGIVLAILSSFRNKALNPKLVAFGEVGLSGEVRAVSMAKQRVAEAEKLGFEECVVPLVSLEECKKGSKIRVIGVSSVQDAVDKVFG